MSIQKVLHSKLADISIKNKIQLIFIPPLVILALFVLAILVSNIQKISSASRIVNTVEIVRVLDAVAHNFAVERGLTAGFLGSGGTQGKEALDKQRIKADTAKKLFLDTYEIEINSLPEKLKPVFKKLEISSTMSINCVRLSIEFRRVRSHLSFIRV